MRLAVLTGALIFAAAVRVPRAMGQVEACGDFGPHLVPYHRPVSKARCPSDVDVVASLETVPAPDYPPMLRSAAVEGRVRMDFIVDQHGRVDTTSFHVLASTHDLFTNAVRDAVTRWIGKPARLNDVAVAQWITVEVDFRSRCAKKRVTAPVKSGDSFDVCG